MRRSSDFAGDGVITWDTTHLNIGNAMNAATGVFTVPKDGVYTFHFSGMKTSDVSSMFILLRLNGNEVGRGDAGGEWSSVSIHSTLSLKSGDKVDVMHIGSKLYSQANQFTGWLLEENLQL